MNLEFKHIAGKDNHVADMLSRARYDVEEDMVDEGEDIGSNFYSTHRQRRKAYVWLHHWSHFRKSPMKGNGYILGGI
jgi:hypothetical protein